ncbi:MAG: ABC transporter substrate-binding protein [Sphaerochaetaceae bacterium]|nr:ABC transporter substrate-binding protein [Sphaerochaetaceae bacterium]
MKRIILMTTILLLCAISILSGAGQTDQTRSPGTAATDASSQRVELPASPSHIAVVGKAALIPADALFMFDSAHTAKVSMAKTNQGLGDFFAFLRDEENPERLSQNIGAEELISMQADLILTKLRNRSALAPVLEPFGIPLFALDLESAEAWSEEILSLGELLNERERALQITQFFREKEENIVNTPLSGPQKRVLVLQATTGDGITSFSVAPGDWIQQEIITKAGGIPVYDESMNAANGWSVVSFEQISAWDPDVIIIVSYRSHGGSYVEQIYDSPLYESLNAVKNNQVYLAPSDYVNYFQSDSRWILALQWLAQTLYPQQFASLDMEQELRDFYSRLYAVQDEKKLDHLVTVYRESLR